MRSTSFTGQNYAGLILVLLGAGFLLQDFYDFNFWDLLGTWWPLLIVGYGVVEYFSNPRQRLVAIATIFLGGFLLAGRLSSGRLDTWDILWPAMLVLAGVTLVLRKPSTVNDADNSVSLTTFLGGIEKRVNSPQFEGGSLTAIMGGCSLDLSRATMTKDARVDIYALMGGVEITVPTDCAIINQTSAILGGVEDSQPAPVDAQQSLIISGAAIMGGIEIKRAK